MWNIHSACQILINLEYRWEIFENPQISNFIQIHPAAAKLFHADRQTDRYDGTSSQFNGILPTAFNRSNEECVLVWSSHPPFENLRTRPQSRREKQAVCIKLMSRDLYTECPRRNGQNFGRVFLMLNYTDITQNTYIQSW